MKKYPKSKVTNLREENKNLKAQLEESHTYHINACKQLISYGVAARGYSPDELQKFMKLAPDSIDFENHEVVFQSCLPEKDSNWEGWNLDFGIWERNNDNMGCTLYRKPKDKTMDKTPEEELDNILADIQKDLKDNTVVDNTTSGPLESICHEDKGEDINRLLDDLEIENQQEKLPAQAKEICRLKKELKFKTSTLYKQWCDYTENPNNLSLKQFQVLKDADMIPEFKYNKWKEITRSSLSEEQFNLLKKNGLLEFNHN